MGVVPMQGDQQEDEEAEMDEDDWIVHNPAIHVVDNMMQVPHHPDQEQDEISFDQSGSTMRYLRASGPNIPIDFTIQSTSSDYDSGSSLIGEVNSPKIHALIGPMP